MVADAIGGFALALVLYVAFLECLYRGARLMHGSFTPQLRNVGCLLELGTNHICHHTFVIVPRRGVYTDGRF